MLKTRRPIPPILKFFTKIVVLLCVVVLLTTPLLGYYLYLGGSLSELPRTSLFPSSSPRPLVPLTEEEMSNIRGTWPGIRCPATKRAKDAILAEDAEVLGLCVEGHARAYALLALSGTPSWHVVNDRLGGRPVSVVYCDRMKCARVFTVEAGNEPLKISVGGWKPDAGMLLHIDGVNYALKDGTNLSHPDDAPLPYQRITPMRTTWGEWRRAHPHTDVYESCPRMPASNPHPV